MAGSRRPGPITPDFWGCRRSCWNAGKHLKDDGCEMAPPPPCMHPVESIGYGSEGEGRQVECQDCRTPLSVRKLAEEATVGLSVGCMCVGCITHPPGECDGHCGAGRALAWSLNPAKVLKILQLEEHL